jgi:hypothetical protein
VALSALAASAGAGEPQSILGLTLGSRAPDQSDAAGLKAAFGEEVASSMTGLLMTDQPESHYQIELRDDRRLSIWFDADTPGRPVYWISLVVNGGPAEGYKAIEQELGSIDYKIAGPTGAPLSVALVQIDPTLPVERQAAIRNHIDTIVATRPKPGSQDDPFIELPTTVAGWTAILGNQFRGKVVCIYTISHHIDGVQTELIDTEVAAKVAGQQ